MTDAKAMSFTFGYVALALTNVLEVHGCRLVQIQAAQTDIFLLLARFQDALVFIQKGFKSRDDRGELLSLIALQVLKVQGEAIFDLVVLVEANLLQ